MAKPWPAELKQECIRRFNEGETLSDIINDTGVPYRTLQRWCNVEINGKRWSDEVKQKCIKLRKEGYSYSLITELTGVSDGTQRSWYPEELRTRGQTKEKREKKSLRVQDYVTTTKYQGLDYKGGVNGRLFYRDELGEWLSSTLKPADVGLASYKQ